MSDVDKLKQQALFTVGGLLLGLSAYKLINRGGGAAKAAPNPITSATEGSEDKSEIGLNLIGAMLKDLNRKTDL